MAMQKPASICLSTSGNRPRTIIWLCMQLYFVLACGASSEPVLSRTEQCSLDAETYCAQMHGTDWGQWFDRLTCFYQTRERCNQSCEQAGGQAVATGYIVHTRIQCCRTYAVQHCSVVHGAQLHEFIPRQGCIDTTYRSCLQSVEDVTVAKHTATPTSMDG